MQEEDPSKLDFVLLLNENMAIESEQARASVLKEEFAQEI